VFCLRKSFRAFVYSIVIWFIITYWINLFLIANTITVSAVFFGILMSIIIFTYFYVIDVAIMDVIGITI